VTLRFRTLSDQIDRALVRERLVAMLSGFFGALVLMLAAIGLYGVTSHALARRRGEIGVRMALGADAPRVVRMMLGRVACFLLVGVLAGSAVSAWAAAYLPARRAARIDPAKVLRES